VLLPTYLNKHNLSDEICSVGLGLGVTVQIDLFWPAIILILDGTGWRAYRLWLFSIKVDTRADTTGALGTMMMGPDSDKTSE